MADSRLSPLLVVEDSDEDFDTFQRAAAAAGLANPIQRAIDGDACIELLNATGDGLVERPVLVFMDLNTPGSDGRDALQTLKADPAFSSIPVVVFSTSANPRDIESCYRVGASAYHVKPVRYEDHLRLLLGVFAYWLGSVTLPGMEGGDA